MSSGKKITASMINPKNKEIDKFYSKNLYRWFLKYKKYPRDRVWIRNDGVKFIGSSDGEYIYGTKLVTVTCSYGKFESWAIRITSEFKEITVSFWSKYFEIGTCAIHDVVNWHNYSGDKCLNCGVIK